MESLRDSLVRRQCSQFGPRHSHRTLHLVVHSAECCASLEAHCALPHCLAPHHCRAPSQFSSGSTSVGIITDRSHRRVPCDACSRCNLFIRPTSIGQRIIRWRRLRGILAGPCLEGHRCRDWSFFRSSNWQCGARRHRGRAVYNQISKGLLVPWREDFHLS